MALAPHQRLNALVDAAQSAEPSLSAWADELTSAAAFLLDHGCGYGLSVVQGGSPHRVELFRPRGVLRDDEISKLYGRFVAEQPDGAMFEELWRLRRPVMQLSAVMPRPTPPAAEVYARAGAVDSFALLAAAGAGRYCSLFGYLPAGQKVSPRVRSMLTHVWPHVEASLRLRFDPSLRPIAVLTDAGKLLHLDTQTELRAFTPELKEHIARLELIRLGRERVEVSPDAWDNICAGRWLLSQCSESDGRKHYVVFEDRGTICDWYEISASDRKIIAYSMNGLNGKQVAAKMKISEAQVSTRLAAIARMLGLRSRAELLRLVAILRPSGRRRAQYQKLTLAEQEVLALLELGRRNEEIAAERGRSVKTVANQVAAILRKTATTSRRAAVAGR